MVTYEEKLAPWERQSIITHLQDEHHFQVNDKWTDGELVAYHAREHGELDFPAPPAHRAPYANVRIGNALAWTLVHWAETHEPRSGSLNDEALAIGIKEWLASFDPAD